MLKRIDWPLTFAVIAIAFVLGFQLALAAFSGGHYRSAPQNRNAKQQSCNGCVDSSADERIAEYTLGLTVFTGFLVLIGFAQVWLIFRSDKTASIAASAAKLSAEAFIAAEGSRISVIQIKLERPLSFGMGFAAADMSTQTFEYLVSNGMVAIRLRNGGKSEAEATAISWNYFIGKDDALPTQPKYSPPRPISPAGTITTQQPYEIWDYMRLPPKGDDLERVTKKGVPFWVFGYVEVRDYVSAPRKIKFCARSMGNLLITSTPDLWLTGPRAYVENNYGQDQNQDT